MYVYIQVKLFMVYLENCDSYTARYVLQPTKRTFSSQFIATFRSCVHDKRSMVATLYSKYLVLNVCNSAGNLTKLISSNLVALALLKIILRMTNDKSANRSRHFRVAC